MSHCSVIKVSVSQTACLLYHIFQILSSTFFNFFRSSFRCFPSPRQPPASSGQSGTDPLDVGKPRLSDSSFTLSHFPSSVNNFFKFLNCLNCIFKMYSCDSSVRITQAHKDVNCFFIFSFKTILPASFLLRTEKIKPQKVRCRA